MVASFAAKRVANLSAINAGAERQYATSPGREEAVEESGSEWGHRSGHVRNRHQIRCHLEHACSSKQASCRSRAPGVS